MTWTPEPHTSDDLKDIALFFEKNYEGPKGYGTESYFRWKILENVFARGEINVIKDGPKVVSTTTLVPKSFTFQGRPIAAAEIGDTHTDSDYQRQGMFTLLINKTREAGIERQMEFIYGTPNDQSLPGYLKRANFRVYEKLNTRLLMIPVDISRLIGARGGTFAKNIISTVSWSCMKAWAKLLAYRGKSFNVECVTSIPADWNAFWTQTSREFDFCFSRTKEAIEWRYLKNPYSYQILVLRQEGKMAGYLIYRVVAEENGRSHRIVIADSLTSKGAEPALYLGLSEILLKAAEIRAGSVSLWVPRSSRMYGTFRSAGFIDRAPIPVICYKNDFTETFLDSAQSFHFSVGDSDNV